MEERLQKILAAAGLCSGLFAERAFCIGQGGREGGSLFRRAGAFKDGADYN